MISRNYSWTSWPVLLCLLYFQEFEAIYQQFFPHGSPRKFAAYVFNIFDTNKVNSNSLAFVMQRLIG